MTDPEKTGGTMNCGVVAELLQSYHSGKLNARARQSVKEHLDGCAACAVRLASLERQSMLSGEGVPASAVSGGKGGSAEADDQRTSGGGWWLGVPKLALIVIGLAAVVVPSSFWFASSRATRDRAPLADESSRTVVAMRRVGDDEARSTGFTLRRPTELWVYALGEGMGGEMYDHGWIVDEATGRTVWSMKYSETERAGGADKNRKIDEVVTLDPGTYVVRYQTDGSHSFEDWNADPPNDEEAWGITVSVVKADDMESIDLAWTPSQDTRRAGREGIEDAVAAARAAAMEVARIAAAEAVRGARTELHREMRRLWSEVELVAQLVRVEDDADLSARFRLDGDSRVHIYALGEATSGEMHDFAWIDDAGTGRTVWRMTYGMTEHAGGAEKNRMVDSVIDLPAGEYVLRYRTDDSHAFDSWNQEAPYDAANYGVTVYKEGR